MGKVVSLVKFQQDSSKKLVTKFEGDGRGVSVSFLTLHKVRQQAQNDEDTVLFDYCNKLIIGNLPLPQPKAPQSFVELYRPPALKELAERLK